jgi:hypothetical protein
MTDEHCDFKTIFNRKDVVVVVVVVTDKRVTWRPRKSTSVGEMTNPFST